MLDVELRKDFTDAAIADDLSKTVNYAKVCSLIMEIVTKNSYNLIEKLAYECAFAIAEKYPVKSVAVVVHKPEAPVAAKFRDISVTAEVVREKVATWPIAYSCLTDDEYKYTIGLFAGKSTFQFTHPKAGSSTETETTTCYCSKYGIAWHNAKTKQWKNLKFNIIEC